MNNNHVGLIRLEDYIPVYDKECIIITLFGATKGKFNKGTFGFIVRTEIGKQLIPGHFIHSWEYIDINDRVDENYIENPYKRIKEANEILRPVKLTFIDKVKIFMMRFKR